MPLIPSPGDLAGGELLYRPDHWRAYSVLAPEVIQATSRLAGFADPKSEADDFAGRTPEPYALRDSPKLVDELARLESADAAAFVAFMEQHGNFAPGAEVLEVSELRAEAGRIARIRDRLGPPGDESAAADWEVTEWMRQGLARYCILTAYPAEPPRLVRVVVVATSPFGLAYLALAAWARSLRGETPEALPLRLPGELRACVNDKCSRPFWRERRQLYCPDCRADGGADAHRQREYRARKARAAP